MFSKWQRVKNIFVHKELEDVEDGKETRPEVGFKIIYNADKEELGVKVIGARNLPTSYGSTKPAGYLVKVKVFPGREKFDTEIQKDSKPCFNQDFQFTQIKNFTGRFVNLTLYSILLDQNKKNSVKINKRSSFKEHIEAFVSKEESGKSGLVRRNSSRYGFNDRRTIGAVTYNLEEKNFTVILKDKCKATPDIWREVASISSGFAVESKESKKGSLEVLMSYSNSEDGKNDLIQISLSKFRCSMKTMQDHEKIGDSLYLKMSIFEYDVPVSKWKGDTFTPTISMKIEPKTATTQATVNNYNLDRVRVQIRLKCKNALIKKEEVGRIDITNTTPIFTQIVAAPTTSVTQMIDFE